MKQLKIGGLAIVMALAMTAVLGISSASAAQFRAEEYPTSVTGTQTVAPKFTTWEKGPSWTCSSMTATGTIAAASTTLSLVPTFTGCQAFGQAATVKMNACSFVFNNSNEQLVNTGTMDVSCTAKNEIEVVTAICTMKIPPQTARGPVQYAGGPVQEGPGGQSYQRKFNITPNATGFRYSLAGVGCGKTGTFEDGGLTGSSLVKGWNAQHEVGVYLSNEQSANFPSFAAEKNPEVVEAEITGATNFKFPGAYPTGFSCSSLRGNGLISGVPKGQLTLGLRSWGGCSVINGGAVKRNGCSFTLAGPVSGAGSLALECPSGKALTFSLNLGACQVTVPSQGLLSSVTYANTGSGATRAITANVGVKGVKYTTNSKAACGTEGLQTNGEMTFTWSLKGYEWVGDEQKEEEEVQYWEHNHSGVQQGLWFN